MTQGFDEGSPLEPRGPQELSWPAACEGRTAVRLRSLCVGRCLSAFGFFLLLVVALAVGAFFAALAHGPIRSDWLVPKIVESLDDLYGHRYAFTLGSAAIDHGRKGLTLTIDRLEVKGGGRIIVAAPRAQLSIDPMALLLGRLMPRRLEALDLELRLAVRPDGVIAVSTPGADPVEIPLDEPAPPTPVEAVAVVTPAAPPALARQAGVALRALLDFVTGPDSPIAAIDRVGVSNATLIIDDRTQERTTTYRDVALKFEKTAGATSLTLAATGPSGRTTAEVEADGRPGERRALDLKVRRLSLDEIALVAGARSLPFDTDAPLSLDLRLAVDAENRLLEASGRLAMGEGFFRLEEPDAEPFMVEALSISARWDAARRRIAIEPIEIAAGAARLSFAGALTPPREDGETRSDLWTLVAALAKPGRFVADSPEEAPMLVGSASLAANFDLVAKRATIERVALDGPEIHASATIGFDGGRPDGPHLTYRIEAKDTPIRSALRIWPTHVAAPTRMWMEEHLPAGVLRAGLLTADLDQQAMLEGRYERPPPDAALRGDFDLEGATIVDAFPGLWPLTGVGGHIALTGRTVAFQATAGVMESAPGHRLAITQGAFRVPALGFDPAPAAIDLRLVGNVEAVADILSLESIAKVADAPVDAGAMHGQVDGRLRIDFELGKAARDEKTRVAIDAEATNVSMERFLGKERLEGATLKVVSDVEGLRVGGSGRVFGAPVVFEARRPPGEKSKTQAQMSLQLDDAARVKAGYAVPGVSGIIGAQVATRLPIEEAEAQVELDFLKATLDNPLPGVAKPAGKPGKASFTLVKRPEGSALEQLSAEAGGAQVSGVVELARDGAFRSARFGQVRLSPGDDMRLDAMRVGDGVKLVVRGANIDARPLLRFLSHPAAEPSAGAENGGKPLADDLELDLRSPIVTGFGRQILANVALDYARRGGRLEQLSLTGSFGRDPLAATIARRQNGSPLIELSTSDGGALLSFLDLYHRMESGAMTASVLMGQGRSDGVIKISDFFLRNEPAMRRLVMQGASRADDKGALHFDPDSVKFSRVQSGFTFAGGRLTMRDGVMSGPETGLTVDGFIDVARDKIDVSGTFVPAYGLNNLMSNIPVIGVMLTGGENEGMFAVSFRVSGAFSAPVLTVNPLSVIAPGLLRKLFGILDGTGRLPEAAAPNPAN
ncbi:MULTISPECIES: YhdP family protein [Methylosinus]|uniref:DUF3971 domain-containing protein n=1 Tax=Methylosinus trichosporium (strain ATCC 35070 / NCIMB 11131 / UNIQEM 75 / OB3b) TaxID=595536 RepID=A0A2D2CVS8_METT3|nr:MULTISPECIES: AsmA-like C-terminal region-containing protein [Methylosinus]ATQ66830.1 hypothetical protein CQW49_02165 [Methylosinus trichosporium OB3b]